MMMHHSLCVLPGGNVTDSPRVNPCKGRAPWTRHQSEQRGFFFNTKVPLPFLAHQTAMWEVLLGPETMLPLGMAVLLLSNKCLAPLRLKPVF